MNESRNEQQNGNPLLEIRGLKKYFPIERGLFRHIVGYVRAVDGVDLSIPAGKTLGLVGESGSGKTTLGRCVMRAYELTDGEIIFRIDGREINITDLGRAEMREVRKHMQMIFQDPYSSLDPRKTVFDIVSEPLRVNKMAGGKELENRVRQVLELVGLGIRYMKRYPHAFSGGQRQRIGIARALIMNPKLIVCDEPVSALDVSVRAQILNLLQDLQAQFDLTYLFIAHDLSVIEHISDEVAVMYVGKIVERAETAALFSDPKHPYTEGLLESIPRPDPEKPLPEEGGLEGELPDPADPPSGCYFHPRCAYAEEICRREEPPLEEIAPGRQAACHFANTLNLKGID